MSNRRALLFKEQGDAPQNLFIGGVGGVITDATILEPYLNDLDASSYSGTITNFTIDGSLNIACTVDLDYQLESLGFYLSPVQSLITYFNDSDGLCKEVSAQSFRACTNFTSFDLLSAITVGQRGFQQTACTDYILTGATQIDNFTFNGCASTEVIDIRNATTLSSDPTVVNNVFINIKLGCTIYANIIMETINGGGVHADLAYARDTRGATLVFIS